MSYNLSQVTVNGTGMLEFAQGVNNVLMFGLLGTLIMGCIWTVFVIVFYRSSEHIGKSVLASSLISTVLGVLLRAVGLFSDIGLYVLVIITAISFFAVLIWD